MNIAILYNRDIYALKALNLLLPAIEAHQLALYHSDRVGRATTHQPASLAKLSGIERELLQQTQERDGRAILNFRELSARYGCADLSLNDVNEAPGLDRLRVFAPDLVVSIRFGKILKAEAIAIPQCGVVNLHSGLLPAFRGVMATFWAMLAEDSTIGATIHWVPDATIDNGPIIGTAEQARSSGHSYLMEVWRLYEVAVPMLAAAVQRIASGDLTLAGTPPVVTGERSHYFSFPDDAALENFSSKGCNLFSTQDVQAIAHELEVAAPSV